MKNIKELFLEGQRQVLTEGIEHEESKQGVLRGGNSAVYYKNEDTVVGRCAAQTYLRYKGIDLMNDTMSEHERLSRELMFEGGRANEDIWTDILKRVYDGVILREEEIPIKWETSKGIPVTGRPDIVLCDKNSKPLQGLELKQVSSVWTGRDVLFMGMPKWDHLCQAGHYSMVLDIPFTLCYTSRSDFAVMGWAIKHFPKQGEKGSEWCEYNDKGDIKKVLPFMVTYDLHWYKDKLYYTREDGQSFVTPITQTSIRDYYELIGSIDDTDKIPAAPKNWKADGKPANWTAPDYCPLGDLCCGKKEIKSAQGWLEEVRAGVCDVSDE